VLPTNLGLALILIYAVLLFPFDPNTRLLLLPIEPTQILWINLVAAVALALPLAFEAKEADVMRRPPRDPKAPVLSRFVLWRTAVAALMMTAGAVGVFLWKYGYYLDPLWRIGLLSNPAVYIGVGTILAAQAAFVYLPPLQSVFGSAALSWGDLGVAALVGFLIVPVVALEKWLLRRLA
jgi:Ca2+-transporting ATPase